MKDCRKETDIAPKPRACCGKSQPAPGVADIHIDRGNLKRNVLMADAGLDARLPAIVIQRDGRRTLATRVVVKGEVRIMQDDSRTPAVWIETSDEVEAFVGDKRLDSI